MSSGAPTLPPGTVLLDKLRVERLLGAGGMGAVYEVSHTLTHHRRALKLLHAELARIPGIVTRFLREASAAGRIGNPHIVETFDAGTLPSGEPYLLMELLQGRSLAELLRERGRLTVSEAVALLTQACEGVQAAHDAGIVHRDLKPDNLFLVDGPRPFVKLVDFGVSRFEPGATGELGMTGEGAALGTPYYMPPEQVRGAADLDARADVYALGVVLYECLTGQRPFQSDSLPHLSYLIHLGQYTPPSALVPGLGTLVDRLVARAMAADRDQRLPSARALAAALATLENDPLAATAASDVAPPVAPAPAPSAAPASTDAPASRTLATSTPGTAPAASPAPGAPAARLALGLAAAVIVAGGLWWARSTSPAEEPAPRALTSAPGPRVEPVTALAATGSEATPPSPTSAAPIIEPAGPSAVVHAASAAPGDPRAPAASRPPRAAPPGTTRASQHGLTEENPFQ